MKNKGCAVVLGLFILAVAAIALVIYLRTRPESTKALTTRVNDASVSADARCSAAGELASRGDRNVVDVLIGWVSTAAAQPPSAPAGSITDPARTLAECGAEHLGTLRDPRGVDPLLAALPFSCDKTRALGNDGGLFVMHTVKALTEIKDQRAVPPLITFLGSAKEPVNLCDLGSTFPLDKSANLGKELAAFGKPAVAPLSAALAEPRRLDLPSEKEVIAASALGGIGGPEAHQALLSHLQSGQASTDAASELRGFYSGHLRELVPYLQAPQTLNVYAALLPGSGDGSIPAAELKAALIDALNRFGTSGMALDFKNSHDKQLEDAAEAWASAHGYTFLPGPPTVP